MATLNERLKELRIEKELTQRQLAAKINTFPQNITYWETGERPCNDIAKQNALADFFNVSLDYLHGRTDKRN